MTGDETSWTGGLFISEDTTYPRVTHSFKRGDRRRHNLASHIQGYITRCGSWYSLAFAVASFPAFCSLNMRTLHIRTSPVVLSDMIFMSISAKDLNDFIHLINIISDWEPLQMAMWFCTRNKPHPTDLSSALPQTSVRTVQYISHSSLAFSLN
ncbi:hypothetical protein M426DRAFT_232623 [Hypoxylon sp. CI-4A]|nr:hypothetical protein M426DRAFT_232623 [Hypoxylon sp. CI-4A]